MDKSSPSPDYGRRLLPVLIDELGNSNCSRPFAIIPRSSKLEDGYLDVTFRSLSRAIDKCAWWIENRLGRSQDFGTVGYLGPADIRYTIVMFAAVKTGHKVGFARGKHLM